MICIKSKGNALTSFILVLILIGMTNFSLHRFYEPECSTSPVSISAVDSDDEHDSFVRDTAPLLRAYYAHKYMFVVLTVLLMQWLINLLAKHHNAKSHIEYCGRKMVKAIMLQWRPS